jgi:hypothetical protein
MQFEHNDDSDCKLMSKSSMMDDVEMQGDLEPIMKPQINYSHIQSSANNNASGVVRESV